MKAGAVHETTDLVLAYEVAVTPVGALGTVDGVAVADADDGPLPMLLVATTVKVYVVPLLRPSRVHEVVEPLAVTQVWPLLAVTVKLVIGDPPVETGAVHDTRDRLSELEVAVTPVGAPGVAAGTIELDTDDAGPVPRALVAVTVNV